MPGITLHNNLDLSWVFHSCNLEIYVLLRQITLASYRWWQPNKLSMAMFSLELFSHVIQVLFISVVSIRSYSEPPNSWAETAGVGAMRIPMPASHCCSSTADEVLICFDIFIPMPFFFLHYKAVYFQNQNNWPCCSWELSFTLENVHIALMYISGRLEYICNTKGLCLKKWLMILAAQLWGTWKKHDKLLVIYVVFTVAVPCFP